MTLELRYPGVLLVASLVISYFAVRLYLKDEHLSIKWKYLLFSLKYAFLSLMVILLFEPVIKSTEYKRHPVKHIMLFDNSRSISLNSKTDSTAFLNFAKKIADSEFFELYLFGEKLRELDSVEQMDFADRTTNISDSDLERMIERSASEGYTGSVNFVSDGNFTDATNFSVKPDMPVNIIYSSEMYEGPDIFIKEIYYPDIVSGKKRSSFTTVVGYTGEKKNIDFTLSLRSEDRLIKSVTEKIPEPDTFTNIDVKLPPPQNDLRELEINIQPIEKERNLYNNSKKAYQRKTGQSGKILIAAPNSSFDLSFLQKMLSENGYEFETVTDNSIPDTLDISDHKLLICVGLPYKNTGSVLKEVIMRSNSSLHFINKNTDLASLEQLLEIKLNNYKYIASTGHISKSSKGPGSYLFVRDNSRIILKDLPEIVYNSAFLPVGNNIESLSGITGSTGTNALYQRKTETRNRIIANFSSFWKLIFNDTNNNFSNFMLNIIDQASIDESKERILINTKKNEYFSGEEILFSGKLLDGNLRPTNKASAEILISENELTAPAEYSGGTYASKLIIEDPGIYNCTIKAYFEDVDLSKKTVLKIVENDRETQTLGTDINSIKRFTSERNGKIIHISDTEDLVKEKKGKFESEEMIRRVSISRNFYFFLILIIVFFTELTLRKFKDLS